MPKKEKYYQRANKVIKSGMDMKRFDEILEMLSGLEKVTGNSVVIVPHKTGVATIFMICPDAPVDFGQRMVRLVKVDVLDKMIEGGIPDHGDFEAYYDMDITVVPVPTVQNANTIMRDLYNNVESGTLRAVELLKISDYNVPCNTAFSRFCLHYCDRANN